RTPLATRIERVEVPAPRTHRDAAAEMAPLFGGKRHLDPMPGAADRQVDVAEPAASPACLDHAGYPPRTGLDEVDEIGPEAEERPAVGEAAGVEAERPVVQPDAAIGDRDGKRARLADEGEDEGRSRRVVDLVGR